MESCSKLSFDQFLAARFTTAIDLMHDDVTRPERQYGSCSHAQIQNGRQ